MMLRRLRTRFPCSAARGSHALLRSWSCALLSMAALSLAWLALPRPQADPAEPAPHAAPGTERGGVAPELFRRNCAKCHGEDGTGSGVRGRIPRAPDFTSRRWQEGHSDAQLTGSILEGKGGEMPAFGGKLSEDQARALVAHVRAFAPAGARRPAGSPEDFRERLRELQGQMDELRQEFRRLSRPPTPAGDPGRSP